MEDEVMEQIRTHLAAATSAAAVLAKSLEALDENTLQTLEFWMSKQEGELRCGQCRGQMPRGKATSVCIACGSKRPPLPNTLEFNFRVSFAFLQFLETIHPPLKIGSRRSWNPIVSPASVSPEPSASTADLPVEHEAAAGVESTEHLKQDFSINDNIPPNDFQENPLDDSNGMNAAEDGREADGVSEADDGKEADDGRYEYGDFQESWGQNAVETSHERTEDVPIIDQCPATSKSAEEEREPEASFSVATSSEVVNSWDTEWDYPTSHSMSAKTQLEVNVPSEMMFKNSKEVTFAPPQVPEYDLSFFDSFGGVGSKDVNFSTDADADATFWDLQNANVVNSKLASVKAMERFASDTSAFTTITDADSDSGDDVLPPPKPPLDFFVELGANSGQNDLLGSLRSHELDDFQRVAASSHPLATSPASQDPFSWPLDTLDTLPSQVVGDDAKNAESSSAATLETSGQVALDPFPWPLEEFDNGTSNVSHATKHQEPVDFMDPGHSQSEAKKVDPFLWPLDTFIQIMPTANKDNVIGLESAFQSQVHDTTENDSEDWGDEEFVGAQIQPANEAQLTSNVDLPPFSSGSSPLGTNFSSNFVAGDVSMDKDKFLLDQSTPKPTVPNPSAASPDNSADLGTGLEILITTEVQKSIAGKDPFKSTHVRSLSFGDSDNKLSASDNIDDLFKRSISFGNLQGKDMAESDELLKALQTPSIPRPAPPSSEPGEDIFNFLNLKPASSQVNVPQGSGSATKPSHVRSISFDKVELVPEEQSDEMFQFFHTRSHSAGSSTTIGSAIVDSHSSSSGKDIFNKTPSMPQAPSVENPPVNYDPFSFIHAAIAPLAQPEAVEVMVDTNSDDDDDFFEWKSADIPSTTPAETSVHTVFQPSAPAPASSEQDLFQWTSPSKPVSSPSKPLGTGSLSGLLSLAGGLPPSKIRTSSKEDDLFAALSRNSSNTGGSQTRQGTMQADAGLQSATEVHSSNPGDDSEDEFSEFVSTGALPPAPLPTSIQQLAGHASQPAFDVSIFEGAQSNPSEKRNLDFFGDLMGLNFTNA